MNHGKDVQKALDCICKEVFSLFKNPRIRCQSALNRNEKARLHQRTGEETKIKSRGAVEERDREPWCHSNRFGQEQ